MSKMARARMDEELKTDAEAVLDAIGLSPSEAIRLLYRQIVIRKAFPLELQVPNLETLAAIKEAENPDRLENIGSLSEILDEDN